MASSLQMTTLDQRGPYPGLCCFYPPDATSCDPEASGGCKSFGDPFEPTNWCHQNSGNCAACTPAGESPFRYCPKNHGMGCYAQAYPDLLKAFCQGKLELCDWSKLLDHWEKFGQAEGRVKDCPRATFTDSPPPLTQPSLPRPPPSPPLLRASPTTSPASSSALYASRQRQLALCSRPSSTKACASLGWHVSIGMLCGSSSAEWVAACATLPGRKQTRGANIRCTLVFLAELSATANTGCNYDTTKDVVWTSEACSVGYEAALSRDRRRTCDFAEKRNAVRCCADEFPQEAAPVDHAPAQERPASTPPLLGSRHRRRRYYRPHQCRHHFHRHYCHRDHSRRSQSLPHHRCRRLLAHGPRDLRSFIAIGATLSTRSQRSATRPSSSSQSRACTAGVRTTLRAARANFGTKPRSWDATRRLAHRARRHRRHPHCHELHFRRHLHLHHHSQHQCNYRRKPSDGRNFPRGCSLSHHRRRCLCRRRYRRCKCCR